MEGLRRIVTFSDVANSECLEGTIAAGCPGVEVQLESVGSNKTDYGENSSEELHFGYRLGEEVGSKKLGFCLVTLGSVS